MKQVLLYLTCFIPPLLCSSQTPQIAVVRPDGTTYICQTFDSAYNHAVNGDFIYLPGGTFNVSNSINKVLYIYGAGYNEDSSITTGITKLNPITILSGGNAGSIEGIYFNTSVSCNQASLTFGDISNSTAFSNYTISNCFLPSGIKFYSDCSNFLIKNNYVGGYSCTNGGPRISLGDSLFNSIISNNIIEQAFYLNSNANLQVNNNIFFFIGAFYYLQLANNSTYNNNIFPIATTAVTNSNFYNNTNISTIGAGNLIYNNVSESFDSIFVNPGPSSQGYIYYYNVHYNYHIRPSSLCKNSGIDGTDKGIYGGTYPWKDGSIPNNPHIYFKQVAPQSNTNGQLEIQIKVRSNN